MKTLIISNFILSFFFNACWADATFTPEQSLLHIPYVQFQDQFYQADLTYIPPNQLRLDNVLPQPLAVQKKAIVPVDDDISFYLSNIVTSGQQYAASMTYEGNNIFQVHNLIESENTSSGQIFFESEHFSGSGICAQCHNGINDEAGTDVSIVRAWETTMMANSVRDPFWQAKVKSELNRTPNQKNVINDTCVRCHAPMANEEARKKQDTLQTVFGQGLLNKENPYHNLAMEGVSCTLCHQISPDGNFGTEAGFSGNFTINSSPKKRDRLIYGPYQNVLFRPMQNFASFTPVFSSHIKTSQLCASCHELITPYTDEQGNIISTEENGFPEQTPYSEWLYSDFSEFGSCQKCHMERSSGVVIASRPQNLNTKRDGFAQHSFLGANRLMLSILQNNREALGVIPTDFSTSIFNAGQLLKNAAKLKILQSSLKDETLDFTLNINSKTGHKLPSAYPSRRIIVHATITDNQGNVVFESGKVNSDGSVENLDSDQNPNQYEPHYQLIDSPQKVQVYETIMHDYQGKLTYTLLRAKSYLKDNRIVPKGFDTKSVPKIIKVYGLAEKDADFADGNDTIQFSINHLSADEYTIKVELIYQTLGYAFAQDLFKDQDHEISRFKQMFKASKLKSTVMSKISLTVNK